MPTYSVTFTVAFSRTTEVPQFKNPTKKQFEAFVKDNKAIKEHHPTHMINDIKILSKVKYIGNNTFTFKCRARSAIPVWDGILFPTLADTEYAAMPGQDTFVYPAPDGSELGVVKFKKIKIQVARMLNHTILNTRL